MLYIYHCLPPSSAKNADSVNFTSKDPLHIDVSTIITPQKRKIILQLAVSAAKYTTVTFYTGIPTSEYESPCGCTGYDSLCQYHDQSCKLRHTSKYLVRNCERDIINVSQHARLAESSDNASDDYVATCMSDHDRHNEWEVAECFCSDIYRTVCDYHKRD